RSEDGRWPQKGTKTHENESRQLVFTFCVSSCLFVAILISGFAPAGSTMSRVRTFIAVEIGDEIRKNAVALQQRLAKADPDVRWATPDTMHLTLLFLGEVDEREVVDVCRVVKDVAGREPPFPLRVSGVGAFPNARRPKTVWAG